MARTIVRRGEKNLLRDPVFELRLEKKKEKGKSVQKMDRMKPVCRGGHVFFVGPFLQRWLGVTRAKWSPGIMRSSAFVLFKMGDINPRSEKASRAAPENHPKPSSSVDLQEESVAQLARTRIRRQWSTGGVSRATGSNPILKRGGGVPQNTVVAKVMSTNYNSNSKKMWCGGLKLAYFSVLVRGLN